MPSSSKVSSVISLILAPILNKRDSFREGSDMFIKIRRRVHVPSEARYDRAVSDQLLHVRVLSVSIRPQVLRQIHTWGTKGQWVEQKA